MSIRRRWGIGSWPGLCLAAVSFALAACSGSGGPSEEAIKDAWGEWHDAQMGDDERYEYQYSIGTSSVVLWPNCVLVNAFDSGGKWMTLVMRDGKVVGVFDGHDAGRHETAQEHGCV